MSDDHAGFPFFVLVPILVQVVTSTDHIEMLSMMCEMKTGQPVKIEPELGADDLSLALDPLEAEMQRQACRLQSPMLAQIA